MFLYYFLCNVNVFRVLSLVECTIETYYLHTVKYTPYLNKNDCALSVKPSNTEMVCVELYKKKIVKIFSLRDISSAESKND